MALCQEPAQPEEGAAAQAQPSWLDLVLGGGGVVGWLIIGLSVAGLALAIDLFLTLRRRRLIPDRLAEQVDAMVAARQYEPALQMCQGDPSLLARVLGAGLEEAGLGAEAVSRAMQETVQERSAGLLRRLEYLSLIANIAPMLGLLGTVIGMVVAFKAIAHLQGPDKGPVLAAGIYYALITTVMGLIVAIPCMSAYSVLRSRVDQRLAELMLLAEQICRPLLRQPPSAASPTGPPTG